MMLKVMKMVFILLHGILLNVILLRGILVNRILQNSLMIFYFILLNGIQLLMIKLNVLDQSVLPQSLSIRQHALERGGVRNPWLNQYLNKWNSALGLLLLKIFRQSKPS